MTYILKSKMGKGPLGSVSRNKQSQPGVSGVTEDQTGKVSFQRNPKAQGRPRGMPLMAKGQQEVIGLFPGVWDLA